jgi:hypothetical protein
MAAAASAQKARVSKVATGGYSAQDMENLNSLQVIVDFWKDPRNQKYAKKQSYPKSKSRTYYELLKRLHGGGSTLAVTTVFRRFQETREDPMMRDKDGVLRPTQQAPSKCSK